MRKRAQHRETILSAERNRLGFGGAARDRMRRSVIVRFRRHFGARMRLGDAEAAHAERIDPIDWRRKRPQTSPPGRASVALIQAFPGKCGGDAGQSRRRSPAALLVIAGPRCMVTILATDVFGTLPLCVGHRDGCPRERSRWTTSPCFQSQEKKRRRRLRPSVPSQSNVRRAVCG